ncbi:uncharacterized protein LOC123310469 [Coccinella septempunctata]|uniref:uncharacterized protein LOC123310469 n=1 Tax=Coccinella septempunctata TaxID=41139 RepID=UPI001D074FD0|nr:uncharacterized protein LOC123310469 [Coccinella septempunctata]
MSLSIFRTMHKIRPFSSSRRTFTAGKIIFNKSSVPSSSQIIDVPGLSSKCLNVPATPVGPGAAKNTNYKNPEYFCYDKNSYFEAEVEMLKFRCEQPSTKVPYYQEKK